MCLVLKLDNGKVVSIANGQTDRVTEPSSTVCFGHEPKSKIYKYRFYFFTTKLVIWITGLILWDYYWHKVMGIYLLRANSNQLQQSKKLIEFFKNIFVFRKHCTIIKFFHLMICNAFSNQIMKNFLCLNILFTFEHISNFSIAIYFPFFPQFFNYYEITKQTKFPLAVIYGSLWRYSNNCETFKKY